MWPISFLVETKTWTRLFSSSDCILEDIVSHTYAGRSCQVPYKLVEIRAQVGPDTILIWKKEMTGVR